MKEEAERQYVILSEVNSSTGILSMVSLPLDGEDVFKRNVFRWKVFK